MHPGGGSLSCVTPFLRGGLLKKGSIVDATIVSVPSSTRNGNNARDPEMHRTKKENQWHFGMKLHVGTDPRGLMHHPEGTAANVHDLTPSGRLLHGEEQQVRTDADIAGSASRRSTRIARCRGRLPWTRAGAGQRGFSGGDGEG